jgi:aldehyde dehydrogenase (NAD+)
MGPLVSGVQWEKVQRLIQVGIDEGATLVCGGVGKPEGVTQDGKGYFVKPTVFGGVTRSMTLANEEIFGPVLSIMPYDSEDEAVEIANDSPYGLAAYVSSGNLEHAQRVGRRLRAGLVVEAERGRGDNVREGWGWWACRQTSKGAECLMNDSQTVFFRRHGYGG